MGCMEGATKYGRPGRAGGGEAGRQGGTGGRGGGSAGSARLRKRAKERSAYPREVEGGSGRTDIQLTEHANDRARKGQQGKKGERWGGTSWEARREGRTDGTGVQEGAGQEGRN